MPVEVAYELGVPAPSEPAGWAQHVASIDRAVMRHVGGTVMYAAGNGSAIPVPGVFDVSYVKVDAGTAGVGSVGPAVFLRLSDLPCDPEKDDPTITAEGKAYRVREVQPDGQGGVLLLLHER